MRRLGTGFRLPLLRLPRLPRRRPRRLPRFTVRTLVLLLLFLITSVGGCAILERRANPQIHELAEVAAKQQASAAVSAAVETVLLEERITYEKLVKYATDGSGIRSIQTNALEVNLIRAKINKAVEESVTFRRGKLKLPMGALMGSSLLSGMGPNVTVPLTMTGHAVSDIRSDLSSSGVNQTMHRILMDLQVSLSVILPGGAETVEIALTVCLAETVIVGNVPSGMITQK